MVLKTRELLVRQRSQTANAMRAHMAELGIVAATGTTSIPMLVAILLNDRNGRLPNSARAALLKMADQIARLTEWVEVLDGKIVAAVKAVDAALRLTTVSAVGPLMAATVLAAVQDPAAFRTGRDLAAWVGITPRANFSGGRDLARSRSVAISSYELY